MENNYDKLLKELEEEFEKRKQEILHLKEMQNRKYKPMFEAERRLYNEKEYNFSIWNDEQGIALLELGELDMAVSSMKEYFESECHTGPIANAEIILRIAEKYPDLCKPSLKDFFNDNPRYKYHGIMTDYYSPGIKLVYLYIDYARYCFHYLKEDWYKELDCIEYGEFANVYVYLWYILESLMDIKSEEMQEYLQEMCCRRERKVLILQEDVSQKKREYYCANVDFITYDEKYHKSIAVTLLSGLTGRFNIDSVTELLSVIGEAHNTYSHYERNMKETETFSSNETAEEIKVSEDDNWTDDWV